ncbi:liver-expressed antimicrobial peptide 2 [Halichoeres trimaculatus]|uniref:liver-expressed antimicrobial peptide 2 n=1 Tax=Halichoeres trimaculatus TaxID=147232 RepID=UPI003D9E021C
MQEGSSVSRRKAVLVFYLVLVVLAQQVYAGPIVQQIQTSMNLEAQSLRRVARMTPLWRIMNSKPFGAYCQNNYECSTGLCRAGHCSNTQRALLETATI